MIIYKLTSPSGKSYVGQTKRDLKTRLSEHYNGRNAEEPSAVSYAFRKYSDISQWNIEVLQECKSQEELNEAEMYWIAELDTFNNGYNMNLGGNVITSGPMSEEHKKALSEARHKFLETEKGIAWREVLSEKFKTDNPSKPGHISWNTGLKMSEDVKQKMSASQRKRYEDPEQRARQSEFIRQSWANGVYDNRPKQSAEVIARAAESKKGFKQSDYQKQKAREANLGKTMSEETKAKLSEAKKGKALKRIECPHCNKIVGTKRWHFDNCKSYIK